MEDTIKIELLTPLTGTFLPNEMEQDWEEEDYNDFEEEQVFFEGDDLTEYASVIQEKIAEYNRVGHDDDRTDNLMDYFDGSAAIKEKVVSAVPSVKEWIEQFREDRRRTGYNFNSILILWVAFKLPIFQIFIKSSKLYFTIIL